MTFILIGNININVILINRLSPVLLSVENDVESSLMMDQPMGADWVLSFIPFSYIKLE